MMRPPKPLCCIVLALSLACAFLFGGAIGGGRYASPFVDDWAFVSGANTDLHDGSTTCNAALAACLSATGGRAIFGGGTYKISPTTGTQVPDTASISGQGMGVTILSAVAGQTGACLLAGTDNTFSDLTFVGNDEATTVGIAITSGKHRLTCTRVEFKDFSTGASGGNGVVNGLVYRDCKWTSNVTGLGVGVASTGVVVEGGVCNGNTTNGISLHGNPVGGKISGVTFVNEPTGIALASSTAIDITGNAFLAGTTSISFSTPVRCSIGDNHCAFDEIIPTDVLNKQIRLRGRYYGNAAPASGTWVGGDMVFAFGNSTNPTLGWVCTSAGTGGVDAVFETMHRGPRVITGTWDPGSLAAGDDAKTSISATGLVIGMTATVQFSENLPDGFIAFAQVTSSTNIDVMLVNVGGATTDVAESTVTVHCFQ